MSSRQAMHDKIAEAVDRFLDEREKGPQIGDLWDQIGEILPEGWTRQLEQHFFSIEQGGANPRAYFSATAWNLRIDPVGRIEAETKDSEIEALTDLLGQVQERWPDGRE